MKSVLRLRQLSVRKSWCQPLPRRHAASLSVKAEDIQDIASPINTSDLPRTTEAGPSRRPDRHLPSPSQGVSNSFFDPVPPISPRKREKLVIQYEDESAAIDQLKKHLKLLKSPIPKENEAKRTWRYYRQISASARQDLPYNILKATLRAAVPDFSDYTPVDRQQRELERHDLTAKLFEQRLETIILDMHQGVAGVKAEDLEFAMESLAKFGSITGVENMNSLMVRIIGTVEATYKEKITQIRLRAVAHRARRVLHLPAYSLKEDRSKQTMLQISRIRPDSPRAVAMMTEGKMILGATWMILMEFTSGSVVATWETIRLVTKTLNYVREVAPEGIFVARLDEMLEQTLTLAYGIDMKYLTLGRWDEDMSFLLGAPEINVIISMLARKRDIYKMLAAAELFDRGNYDKLVSRALAISSTTSGDDTVAVDGDNDQPSAATDQVDMFGRRKGSSLVGDIFHEVSEAMHAKSHDRSKAEFLPVVSPDNDIRVYSDYRSFERPSLDTMTSAAQAFHSRLSGAPTKERLSMLAQKFTTAWRNMNMTTFAIMFNAVWDERDIDATLHLTRYYLEVVREQQAYFMCRALQEHQRRIAAVQYIDAIAKKENEVAQTEAGESAVAKRDWKKLALRYYLKTQDAIVLDPASTDFEWPDSISPPRVYLDMKFLRIPELMAKAAGDHRHMLREINKLVAQCREEVRADHLVLAGRPCTGQNLDLDEYIETMKKDPIGYNGENAPAEKYFFTPFERVDPDQVDIVNYLYWMDKQHTRMTEMLKDSYLQKETARTSRVRKTVKQELVAKKREDEARMEQEAQESEAETRARNLRQAQRAEEMLQQAGRTSRVY